jgi:hypothetical protein
VRQNRGFAGASQSVQLEVLAAADGALDRFDGDLLLVC